MLLLFYIGYHFSFDGRVRVGQGNRVHWSNQNGVCISEMVLTKTFISLLKYFLILFYIVSKKNIFIPKNGDWWGVLGVGI